MSTKQRPGTGGLRIIIPSPQKPTPALATSPTPLFPPEPNRTACGTYRPADSSQFASPAHPKNPESVGARLFYGHSQRSFPRSQRTVSAGSSRGAHIARAASTIQRAGLCVRACVYEFVCACACSVHVSVGGNGRLTEARSEAVR